METPKNQEQVLDFVSLGTIEDDILAMPTLYSVDTNGKYRLWTIYIGITTNTEEPMKYLVPVDDNYINREDLPKKSCGFYWTVSGIEGKKMTKSEYTYIHKGKYTGKKNYTTPFTQAIIDARSLYNKKVKKGHNTNREAFKPADHVYSFEELLEDKSRDEYPWRVFAMAVHDYKKFKSKIHYPATIQRKLDGTLFIVVYHPNLPKIRVKFHRPSQYPDDDCIDINEISMDGYSRSRETYEKQDHIFEELYPVLKKYPGLHLVGELWKKGYGLQEISGMSRRKLDIDTHGLKYVEFDYNVFDCFYIDQPEIGFEDRQYILDDIFGCLSESGIDKSVIQRVQTYDVATEVEMLKYYKTFLKEKMEGAVVRNKDALYEFGVNKEIRSYQSLKIKPRPDAEWPVVGFTNGKGKELGLIIWICAENSDKPFSERKKFNVTPNQPADARRNIFEKLSKEKEFFEKNIYGQNAVISYSILSEAGLPQQPKMLRFRDEKIDKLLQE